MGVNVAYPGRDGAHSAAACDSLFPTGTELVPLPSFTAVVAATAEGEVAFGVLPIESSLTGPVNETHDLLYESPLSITGETVLRDPALPRWAEGSPPRGDQDRPLASRRPRPVPPPARGHALDDGDRVCHDRRRGLRGLGARRPDGGGDRQRTGRAHVRADGHRRRRGRPSRGLHALRLGRAVHAHRPRRRELAYRVLLRDRSPAGRSAQGDRALRPPFARPRAARLAADPVDAVALPLRRGAGRASPRPDRHARPSPRCRASRASCASSARTRPTLRAWTVGWPHRAGGRRSARPESRSPWMRSTSPSSRARGRES